MIPGSPPPRPSAPLNLESGRHVVKKPGFSYLPQFISVAESRALIAYFGELQPLWEQRHSGGAHERSLQHTRRLTRPVYWLGAWQFASLGYYAEPDHRLHRCLRAEPFPAILQELLERVGPLLERDHEADREPLEPNSLPINRTSWGLPNTCLINYYGRIVGDGVPVDRARLRMHRDGEPGPVVMFNIGQPGLLEFLDPEISEEPELRVWTRHRSLTIISGQEFKNRLYHRVSQVRMGAEPALHCPLKNFQLRRVSVSFRHVPQELIEDFSALPPPQRTKIRQYVQELAESSDHFRAQLQADELQAEND